MGIIQLFKKWSLLFAIAVGMTVYCVFRFITPLQGIGSVAGPILQSLMPWCLFLILYVTFCKIEVKELRPRTWHFILQGIRIALSGLLVLVIMHTTNPDARLLWEGCFLCVICPTAAAAAVITEKLGGSITSLTIYTIIANCVTSIIIPLFFPLVEPSANIPFLSMSLMILKRVFTVLVMPLMLAFITRRYLHQLSDSIRASKNIGYYLWCFNLTIVSGVTMHNIVESNVSGVILALLLIIPLFVSVFLFSIGKAVGYPFGDSITAGQALGQKNTIVGIWLTITFLNPLVAIAAGGYLVWQNIINAVQIRYKEKYGYIKW